MEIRKSQMEALQDAAEKKFVHAVMEYLREHESDEVAPLTDAVLEERVRFAITRAESYGFTWQSAIVGFVAMMFQVGPDFDRHPAFAKALEIQRTSGEENEDERVVLIFEHVTDEEWDDAQAKSDTSVWPDRMRWRP